MQEILMSVLHRPQNASLRFLPEGPRACGDNRLSWVSIQHGAEASRGSLNIYDFISDTNTNYPLSGRPGFACPTNQFNTFVVGMERRIVAINLETAEEIVVQDGVDSQVDGTIINDGLVFDQGLVFGTKDLELTHPKAGLYLWRRTDSSLVNLRSDQICSNGKVILGEGPKRILLDIDSPSQTIVRYELDIDAGTLSEPEIVVDLRNQGVFPDGMIATPDQRSVIVAIYNPEPVLFGETRQYGIETGQLECVWRTPASPQVTCPQLIESSDGVKLVVTTAVECMPAEAQQSATNAGCLFIGDTDFDSLPQPLFFEMPNTG